MPRTATSIRLSFWSPISPLPELTEEKDDENEDEDEGLSIAGSVDWRERPWPLEVDSVNCDAGGVLANGALALVS